MKLSVQVEPRAAAALHGVGTMPQGAVELRERLKALGVTLDAVHPGMTDPLLMPHFAVVVPDDEPLLARVRNVLATSPVVEGAFVKPDDALP